MLPATFNNLESQPVFFPQNQPPHLPPQQLIHPNAQGFLVPAAASIANKVTELAASGRSMVLTFYYNLIVRNNWQNQIFEDLVKFICDRTVLAMTRNPSMNPFVEIDSMSQQYIMIHASSICTQYPELLHYLPSDVAANVQQNAQVFVRFKGETETLYGYNQSHYPQQQSTRVYAQQQFNRPSMNMTNPAVAGHTMPTGNRQEASTTPRHSRFPTTSQYTRQNTAKVQVHNENVPNATVSGQRHELLSRNVSLKRPPLDFKEELTGEEEMDRESHAMVYSGRRFVAPTPAKGVRNSLAEKAKEIAEIIEQKADIVPVDDIIIEQTLQEALIAIQAKYSDQVDPENIQVFSNSVVILHPVIASTKIHQVFNDLKPKTTFGAIAEVLGNYLDAAIKLGDKKESLARIAWVKQLDHLLSQYLSLHFKHFNSISGFKITSLIEDGPSISAYVNKTYQSKLNAPFQAFQRLFCQNLFSTVRSSEHVLPDMEEGAHPPVDYNILTFKYAVHYITALSSTLSYKVTREVKHVTASGNPVLHDLLTQLNKLSKNTDATTQMLMTLDGRLYQFVESVDTNGEFKIFEV